MTIQFTATLPETDSGRLLMALPPDAGSLLGGKHTAKVNVTIHDKTYVCNIYQKEKGEFFLHIIRAMKRDIGLGSTVTFTIEGTKEPDQSIHKDVLHWETTECKQIMQHVGIKENDIVIDFGCGYGHYTLACGLVLNNTGKVYAIDCDKKALNYIEEKKQTYHIQNIEPIKNDGSPIIDIPDNSADFILLYDVIHIQDKQSKHSMASSLYKEANRVLKTGGILSTLNFESDFRKLSGCTKNKEKITLEGIHQDMIRSGFIFSHSVDDGVHFDWYHSDYRMRKGISFTELERGIIYNFKKV